MIKQFNHSIQCFTVSRTCAPIKIKLFLLDGVWTKSNLNGIWWNLMRFRQLFFIVYPFEWAFKEESVRSRRHLSVNWLPNKAQSFKGKKVLTTFQRILRGNVVAICHECISDLQARCLVVLLSTSQCPIVNSYYTFGQKC